MTKKPQEREAPHANVPAPQDEEEILEEVGGEVDPETGELLVDEETVRKLGAADAETLREDRRIRTVANKQKTGKRGVSFGTDDPLAKYDGLLKVWGPNSLYIRVKRLTGAQVVHVIRSCPRSGDDLYTALMTVHGQHPEAEYELRFQSTDGHQWRGTGRITLPETRPIAQQGQPMPSPYYPQAYGAPPPQPPMAAPPQGGPPSDPAAVAAAWFQLFQSMQPQPQPQPQAPQQPPYAAPQPQPQMPPMPPGTDPAVAEAWFRIFRQMQGTPPQRGAPPPQAPYAPQPAMQGPPSAPPPGMIWAWEPSYGAFVLMPMPGQQGPMYRPRAPYYPQQGERPAPYMQPQQPQRQQSPVEHFREAIGVVKMVAGLAEEVGGITGQHGGGYDEPAAADPDSPVRIVETGKGKLIYDKQDNLRGWESLLTNLPDMLKWGGEQIDKINKASVERRSAAEQPRVLPNGYVEVGPGYKPPDGYVAVPVDRIPPQAQDQGLPPPPANVPPPIQATPPRRAWEVPTIPDSEEG